MTELDVLYTTSSFDRIEIHFHIRKRQLKIEKILNKIKNNN